MVSVRERLAEAADDVIASLEIDASDDSRDGPLAPRLRRLAVHAVRDQDSMASEWLPVLGLATTARRWYRGERLAMDDAPPLFWSAYQAVSVGVGVGVCIYLQRLF
jgi:hypothetical protein